MNLHSTISEATQAIVVSHMGGAPVLDLVTSDDESESEEEPSPASKKTSLKSGKVRTEDSSVLHTVVWPHKSGLHHNWEASQIGGHLYSTIQQWMPGHHGH